MLGEHLVRSNGANDTLRDRGAPDFSIAVTCCGSRKNTLAYVSVPDPWICQRGSSPDATGRGASDFSSSSKTKATSPTDQANIATWRGSYGRRVPFKGVSGEHEAAERTQER